MIKRNPTATFASKAANPAFCRGRPGISLPHSMNMSLCLPISSAAGFFLAGLTLAGNAAPSPVDLWKDYDPNRGDFKEELVKEETRDGILNRESYISAYVLGEEVRVYCKYSVREGTARAPGLLNVHGWMGAPAVGKDYVQEGWAVLAHDYCGKTGNRPHFTKYPEALRHGNMDRTVAGPVNSTTADGKDITDPKQTSDYLWYAIQRRALSYLERQKEVDPSRLGASGYSYGGTLMWNLATDPRVKAVVPHFGIGYNEYYRNKQVWMYNVPYVEPQKSPGEELYLTSVAPEAHVPYMTAATLFLNGSNDHHGGHERGLESFKKFRPTVPWSFAIQARGHHDTEKVEQNTKLWLAKHVLGRDIPWPAHPGASLRLKENGVPELVLEPASPEAVSKVELFYALKNPCSFARSWRDAPATRKGGQWTGELPVINVDDYLFAYANVTYATTIVRSSDFLAVIPSRLGPARATDKTSEAISENGYHLWTNVAELEGPNGIKCFRPTNNQRGSGTEQLHDPKWKAPAHCHLTFKFFCTEPQRVLLNASNYHSTELAITASDGWQEIVVPAATLTNRFSQRPLKDWSEIGEISFLPKAGADLTKVLFADFRWKPAPKTEAPATEKPPLRSKVE
jgi:dienelactone hydrolase